MGSRAFAEKLLDDSVAQRVFLFCVLTSLNCLRFNCHSKCVSGNWRLMSECMNFSFWQVRQHLKHGAHSTAVSRQHVHEIHIANISATRTTSSSALNKNILTSAALFSKDDKCKLPPDSPTFSEPFDDLLGKTESYLVSEMRGVLREE